MKLLEVQNIEKTYKKTKAVNNISFSVDEGQIVGLLGLNGAGKSTTIEMIATLLKPDHGVIYYKGRNIITEPRFVRNEMGYVPQNIMLFEELSGMENLKFWAKAYGLSGRPMETAIAQVMAICDLEEKISLPVKTYSGGLQRRLNIAVAVLHQPKLLILDEATVGVDIVSADKILRVIKELNQRYATSVIFTSHNMTEAETLCDRFLILDKGSIVSDILKADAITSYGSLQQYFLQIVSPESGQ